MTRPDTHRAPRTALVAGALTVVTLAAHTAGGGAVDGISAVVVLALAVALATGIANRRVRLIGLVPALLGAQVVLHLLMSVTGAHGTGHASGSGAPMIAAHIAATAVIAAVVVHADGLLAAWSTLLRTALGTSLAALTVPDVGASRATTVAPTHPTLALLLHRVERRGPPTVWHLQPN